MDTGDITRLLSRWKAGDAEAEEELIEAIYPRLHALASSRLPKNDRAVTLRTTELLHETYLKLIRQSRVSWQDRAHFFAIAARLMRRIVLDHVRYKKRSKRGSGKPPLTLEEAAGVAVEADLDWLQLDQALNRLKVIDPQAEQVVEMRFFAGLTADESAEVLQIHPSAVARSWRFARAWLKRELGQGAADE